MAFQQGESWMSGFLFGQAGIEALPVGNLAENLAWAGNASLPGLNNLARLQRNWVPGVKRIAVLRANAIGDFIFAIPALQALRLAYPQAEIVLFGLQWHADFLENRPGPVDRVVVIPPMEGLHWDAQVEKDLQEVEAFFEAQRQEHFDLALQMHGGGRHSNRFVQRLGARLTAGSRDRDAGPLDRWIPYFYFQLEYLRMLEVVGLVGALPLALDASIELTAADLEEARQVMPPGDLPLVALHPSAGDPRRRWPPHKFALVADELARSGAQVVVIGAYEDPAINRQVIEAMQCPALDLHGQLSLGGLAALLSRCKLLISNDSGPLHVAGAVGAPTVGIYWCGNMITANSMTFQRRRVAISWRLNCPVCGANTIEADCSHRPSFVADVSTEEVLALAMELYHVKGSHF
jgi:ADP-heptose:LPS heptosyltransferase